MQQTTAYEPRAITRMVYGNAIRAAITEGERQELLGALGWYEMKWQAQDAQARQAQQAEARQRLEGSAPGTPRPLSAVEEHGVDSPQAAAKREARRAARQERLARGGGGRGEGTDEEAA